MSFWRYSYLGNLPSGEVFSYGFYVEDGGAATITQMLTTASSGLTALLTTTSGFQAYWNTTLKWSAINVDLVSGLDGSIIDSDQAAVSLTGNTAASNPLPPQVAVCVTLRSATMSARGRGRFYLPAPAAGALAGTGRILPAAVTALKVSLNAMWTALGGASQPVLPQVFSKVSSTFHQGTTYDVGDVFDTMRSRRNKLVESRTGAAV
jgi:hypothetical protein